MWEVSLEEITLPQGWKFKETVDFLYLIGPDNKIHLVWPAKGPTKEDIKKDLEWFFSSQRS